MTTYTVVTLTNEENTYIAYGTRPENMPVYETFDGYHRRAPRSMRYPSCVRFMPFGRATRPVKMEDGELEARYGPRLKADELPPGVAGPA